MFRNCLEGQVNRCVVSGVLPKDQLVLFREKLDLLQVLMAAWQLCHSRIGLMRAEGARDE